MSTGIGPLRLSFDTHWINAARDESQRMKPVSVSHEACIRNKF